MPSTPQTKRLSMAIKVVHANRQVATSAIDRKSDISGKRNDHNFFSASVAIINNFSDEDALGKVAAEG